MFRDGRVKKVHVFDAFLGMVIERYTLLEQERQM